MDMTTALDISASAMRSQTMRLRVIAENLANQDTTGSSPGGTPYRRKTITFGEVLAHGTASGQVKVQRIGHDSSEFPLRYDPGHPAADANGYVRTPNVNPMIEVMDMREAQRSYSANVSVMQISRSMISQTIDMLK
jgi:flagellar basal-body rod protein FlgC